MSKRKMFRNDSEKAFYDVIQKLAGRHNMWTVWTDFVRLFACSLAIPLEPDPEKRSARVKLYRDTAKAYTPDEMAQFTELVAITVLALEKNPQQDFLGKLYMSLDFGSSWHGQFFTPWDVASLMSKITFADVHEIVQHDGYATINDNTCGAGCMLLAAADNYRNGRPGEARNYQTDLLFVAQDIDPVVAQMCYIQLSLMGCAGYVAIGNSLTNPVCGNVLNPMIGEGGELWFMPMWYSQVWQYRRLFDRLRRLEEAAG